MAPGLVVAIAALFVAAASGLAWRLRNGRVRAGTRSAASQITLTPGQLGQPLGERATLVQFSSAFCAPCRATSRILTEVAGMVDGVTYTDIDAQARLDLVRTLGILRTPTVLVLGPGGQVVRRASGEPRKADIIAALGEVVAANSG
jgi:thiol-disulfide isomerase/thioredoxin